MASEKLNSAIAAIKLGDKATGSRFLNELLKDEPSNETAWIWLTTCFDDIGMKIYCLKKALAINPNNQIVVKALSKLEQPPQPTLEEIVPISTKEILSSSVKPISNQVETKITASEIKPYTSTPILQSPTKVAPKKPVNRKIIYCSIIGGLLIMGLCGIYLLFVVLGDNSSTSTSSSSSSVYNESDALQLVQNWKPPMNKGMTCKETFDSVAFVYKNNLGISDATVKWSALKQSESLFTVYASLKGETGWADFSWQVKIPEEKITPLGEINLCK